MARAEIDEVIQDELGNALSGASVLVNARGGSAATVYLAETGPTTVPNPIITPATGRVEGWLDEGSYDLVVTSSGVQPYTQPFESVSGASTPSAHNDRHVTGGADAFAVTDLLDAVARSQVKKDGSIVGTRRGVNFTAGSGITIVATDDSGNEEVDVAFSSTSFGAARKVTAKLVENTVTETDLLNGEITIAAGAMGATGVLKLSAWGDGLYNDGIDNVQRLRLKFGAATVIAMGDPSATITYVGGAVRQAWMVTATIQNLTATTQWVTFESWFTGELNAAGVVVASTGVGAAQAVTTGATNFSWTSHIAAAGTVDTALAALLELTVVNGVAHADYETQLLGALVEIV